MVPQKEPVAGVVSMWSDEEGWGVLNSEHTPGGCWCHFSAVTLAGFRRLTAGATVEFLFEEAEQDGYRYRAVEAWLVGTRHPASTARDASGEPFSTFVAPDPAAPGCCPCPE